MDLPEHLLPFQAVDAARLAAPGHHVLHEPMGSGKSVMCVAAAESLDAFTIVVLCPAILRADWRAKFLQFGRNSYVYEPQLPGRRVIIASYDSVNTPMRRERLLQHVKRIDVLILDEAQRLKSVDAATVSSVYGHSADGTGLVALAKRVWIVSGTLCPNNWGEMYTHLRACFPERLPKRNGVPMGYLDFLDNYCHWEPTPFGFKVLGNKDPQGLRELVHGVAIYRDPQEIEQLLPPLTVSTLLLPADSIDREAYAQLIEGEEGRALREALRAMEADAAAAETPSLAAARHTLGQLKAPAVSAYVRELLRTEDNRILVFAHHKSVLRRIAQDLSDLGPVDVIDGDVPEAVRQVYIDCFQKQLRRVLVLGIGTAREGITLTAANRVVFAEASWTPAHNNQAIHRAQRIGQTRPVFAEFVSVADTLDEAVMRVCARKSRLLAEVL